MHNFIIISIRCCYYFYNLLFLNRHHCTALPAFVRIENCRRFNDSRTAISVSPPFNCVFALRTTQTMIERRSELGAIIVINYYYVLAKNPHIITIDWHEMHYSQTLFNILFSKALHEVVCANCENDNYIRDAHLSMYKYIYLSVYTEHQPHWVSTTDETTTTPNGINWGKKALNALVATGISKYLFCRTQIQFN